MKPQLFDSLKGYKLKDLPKDLMAGLMVAIIALPLSIALGIQSVPGNNGIQCGIITAIVAGFFISALGGSKYQIGGPTAAFVVILFGYLSNPEIGVLGLAIAGMIAGVLLILMGLLRAGNVMKFFPYPITIGFTTGIGITLILGQIKDFCGLVIPTKANETEKVISESIEKVISYIQNITTFDLATFGVGILGLLCVILLPKLSKKIPAAFVALIVCTGATALLNGFAKTNIATIGSRYGEVNAGFFPVDFSGIGKLNFGALIVPSIVIAFLCAIESLLSATVAGGMTGTTFNANQELMGQGVANICSSLLGGLPATGAIARTAASIENGAKSPLAGIFHSVFILIMYFALMDVVKFIPLSVFSAILISVAINMSRFPLFAKLTRFGVSDVIILFVTCLLTVLFDLTYGVLGGLAVTFILNIKSFMTGFRVQKDDNNSNVIKVSGALFFVNANKLVDSLAKELETLDTIDVDMSGLVSIDQTAMEKLAVFSRKTRLAGKSVGFIGQTDKVKVRFDKFFKIF